MSINTMQIHPHELREAARLARYPNSVAEREALEHIDREVFARVRDHERRLIDVSRALIEDAAVSEDAVAEIVAQIGEHIRYPLLDGAEPTAELADRYETLRRLADQARSALERAERDAEFQAAKLEDPYADLMSLYDRWPTIRPSIV